MGAGYGASHHTPCAAGYGKPYAGILLPRAALRSPTVKMCRPCGAP